MAANHPNADIGPHDFTYSIYPHAGRWQDAKTVEMAYDLNVEPVVVLQDANEGAAKTDSFLRCDADNCFVEVLKRAEDGNGTIVRMYENRNKFTKTAIRFAGKVEKVYDCDLMENNEAELPVSGNAVEVTFKPFEIKTFRIL